MNFTFKAVKGFCPFCEAFGRIWYIQDKCIGNDVYEYCLMSKELKERIVYKFKNHAEIAKWLNKGVFKSGITSVIINCWD